MSLLIQESPLLTLPTLAQSIGLEEAILLQQLHFRLSHQGQERDGKLLYCQSYTSWAKQLPFWSESKIKRLFLKLESEGFIQSTDKYNTFYVDRTKWYSVEYRALDAFLHANTNENYPTIAHTQTLPTSTGERSDRAQLKRSKRKDFKDVQKKKDKAHLSLFAKNEQSTKQQEEREQTNMMSNHITHWYNGTTCNNANKKIAINSQHPQQHELTQLAQQLDKLALHSP